ncbi:MAG: hypothetical protein K2K89_05810 [Ruminococcus sp.]|nr:hypothetical protein [Ruminococcus sp.]
MKKIISFLVSGITAFTAMATGGVITADEAVAEPVTYTIQDLKNLQDFLLNIPTEENLSEKSYDLNGDGRCDVFDLCLLRCEVLKLMENQNDTLVVYFSRTGNTEKIAEYLIEVTNADSYVIEAAIPYTDDDIAYTNSSCRANKEQNDKTARPEIAEPIESIESYDVIYLGYPIWWGEEPRIIDTFLESYDFSDKIVIPFCTSASSGNTTSEKNIKNLVPIGNQLEGKRFSINSSYNDVASWVESLSIPQKKENMKLNIEVNGHILTATLADNPSAKALAEMLEIEPLTITLDNYSNFEKVGALPQSLPKNDENITAEAGDIVLYQGNQLVLFYDSNRWSYTRLGKVDNTTQEELKKILGDESVTVTLSVK